MGTDCKSALSGTLKVTGEDKTPIKKEEEKK